MPLTVDPALAGRIKSAWSQLSPAQQNQLSGPISNAHQQAQFVSQTGKAPPGPSAPHHLMLAQTALTGDAAGVAASLQPDTVIDVGPDGLIWGTGKFQQLDPGWVEAFAVFLETTVFGGQHEFIGSPQVIQIPDKVTLAMAGDWGTGNWGSAADPAPSTDVGHALAAFNADITIHLGDVYYSGTSGQEQQQLVALWPKGAIGSLALNSNHEMYSGAKPYFQAISNAPFEMQKGCSYFALENANWIIVGLDSAYFADSGNLYLDGAIFPAGHPNVQNDFLLEQWSKASNGGKKLIVLTHHNGLDEPGASTTALWDQVMNACPGGGPSFWYWGHVHAGAIYQGRNVACRCCGHGALPWGIATELSNANVAWYEKRPAGDPDLPQRVFNGFALLSLDGANIKEAFYDENGGAASP